MYCIEQYALYFLGIEELWKVLGTGKHISKGRCDVPSQKDHEKLIHVDFLSFYPGRQLVLCDLLRSQQLLSHFLVIPWSTVFCMLKATFWVPVKRKRRENVEKVRLLSEVPDTFHSLVVTLWSGWIAKTWPQLYY